MKRAASIHAGIKAITLNPIVADDEILVRMHTGPETIAVIPRAYIAVVATEDIRHRLAIVVALVAHVLTLGTAATRIAGMTKANTRRTGLGAIAKQPIVARRSVREGGANRRLSRTRVARLDLAGGIAAVAR